MPKIAVICNPLLDRDGFGDFLFRALKSFCDATHFNTGEEVEGFDEYFYIDDGPSYYDRPKFHPATYFAIDFVVPDIWFTHPGKVYLERINNFDHTYVFTTSTQKYCIENGLDARMIGFAADPYHHKPYHVENKIDWIAVWHNCGDRRPALETVQARFPNGYWIWAGTGDAWKGEHTYSEYISKARCSLNWLRANMTNMRVFEVMATGVPLITTRQEDMSYFGFKEDIHYFGYEGVDEMMDKIQWVLDYPEESIEIAKEARRLVLLEHTYYHRALQVLSDYW